MTSKLLGLKVSRPEIFPINSLFAVRVATWIKDHYPEQKFEAAFLALATGYWSKGINVSIPEGVLEALADQFTRREIEDIMENAMTPANKKRVIDLTMGTRAFGAPWIVAVNGNGERNDWFGNDRWDQIFDHLRVPYTPVKIVPPEELKGKL